jgi:hypothetical protein
MYVRGYLQGSENGRVVTIDENCRRPGVAILDMQMSKVPIISGYDLLPTYLFSK